MDYNQILHTSKDHQIQDDRSMDVDNKSYIRFAVVQGTLLW